MYSVLQECRLPFANDLKTRKGMPKSELSMKACNGDRWEQRRELYNNSPHGV
jgi:hypothetical protein